MNLLAAPTWQALDSLIIEADCIEAMRAIPDCSVDAVVCDPPYGLEFMGKEWDGADGFRRSLNPADVDRDSAFGRVSRTSPEYRAGKLFQDWTERWAAEALRVLKPGGHLLAFGGTRTYHRLAAGVEDAGFEIRDSLLWLYGSGFPKSLDVSKAIDKRRDDEPAVREVCRFLRRSIEDSAESVRSIAARFEFHPRMVEHWAARDSDSQPTLPTLEQWDQLRDLLAFDDSMDAEVLRLNLRKGEPGEAWADRSITGEVEEWENRSNYTLTSRDGLRRDLPATPEAEQWQGWGTALKPAHEPIVVARKPLIGTVAENVLEHGCGGLNIDGCRIETQARPLRESRDEVARNAFGDGLNGSRAAGETSVGRWPANVVLSHTPLCEPVGTRIVKGDPRETGDGDRPGGFADVGAESGDGEPNAPVYGDEEVVEWDCAPGCPVAALNYRPNSGGASRFFYQAKTSRGERNAGLESFEAVERPNGNKWTDRDYRVERGERSAGRESGPRKNVHPTVKPINLMRWLVRLVTPPNGVLLDPFAGSGSTGCAAVLEGFDFVGIERETAYAEIARARIAFWAQHKGREVEDVLGAYAVSRREADAHSERGQGSLLEGAAA